MYNVKNSNFNKGGIRYQTVFIATKIDSIEDDYGNIIPQYEEPVSYRLNVMPLSENIDIQAFGESSTRTKVSVLDYQMYKGKFKDFDVAYLDGATPTGEIENGSNANYVLMVREQNKIIKLYFQKIVKGE